MTRIFLAVVVFVNLNQSVSVLVPIFAEMFVLTEIVLAADKELFVSYESVHEVEIIACVVKLAPTV